MAAVKATSNGSGILSKATPVSPHIAGGHGVPKEIADLRSDVLKALAPMAAIAVDEFTAPATGSTLTLSKTPKSRAGARNILREYVDGALVEPPTGTVNSTTYTPATAPNGAHNYVIYYEFDATT